MISPTPTSPQLLVKIHLPRHWWQWICLALVLLGVVSMGSAAAFYRINQDKIYPGVSIDDVDVGGLTPAAAHQRLEMFASPLPEYQVSAMVDDIQVSSAAAQLGLHRQYDHSINQAFQVGRQGPWWQRLKTVISQQLQPTQLSTPLAYEPEKVSQLITVLVKQVDTPYQEPKATLQTSGVPTSVVITQGTIGRAVDSARLRELIAETTPPAPHTVVAPVASIGAVLSETEIKAFTDRASAFASKKASFTGERVTLRLTDQELVRLLAYPTGVAEGSTSDLLQKWHDLVNRPAQDPELVYDKDTLKVTTFKPPVTGLALDREQTRQEIEKIVYTIDQQAISNKDVLPDQATDSAKPQTLFEEKLALTVTQPKKSLASTNDLGINELIGFGESEYAHSIPSRIHNVAHATNKINAYIIKPDEEFSFNKALGDISQSTGYKPAYVISGGQTVLGDGGGVCQVSTTLFRSVLNAGLPVTKRKAHSYRVSYYELDSKPGIDATVYSGDVDLRFINDTGHHILIYGETDSDRLYMKMELYGTSDGRTTEITDHVTYDFRSAPAPVYIPDPGLKPGQLKQIDWAASGIKAKFKNIVKDKDGNLIREENYYSNYVPWSAKYLRGV